MNDHFDRRLEESLKSVSAALRESRVERAVRSRTEFRRRLRRRRVTSFASIAVAASVVGAAVAVAATQGTDLFERTDRTPSIPAPPAGTYIRVGDEPVGVSVGGSSVWVASSEGTITRVSPATNRSTAVINVGGEPSDIALTKDYVWYSDSADGTVKRLDIALEQFAGQPLTIGSQAVHIDVDVGPQGTVWVTSPDFGGLIAIDPSTGLERRRVLMNAPVELAIGSGVMWALIDGGDSLLRYDFASSDETTMLIDQEEKTDLAATDSAVYVAEAGGTILRIDAAGGAVTASASVAGTKPEIAVGDGVLWVASDQDGVDAELVPLDLDDLSVAGKRRTFVGAPTDIALGRGSIWVTDTGRETVVRLKARR